MTSWIIIRLISINKCKFVWLHLTTYFLPFFSSASRLRIRKGFCCNGKWKYYFVQEIYAELQSIKTYTKTEAKLAFVNITKGFRTYGSVFFEIQVRDNKWTVIYKYYYNIHCMINRIHNTYDKGKKNNLLLLFNIITIL